jgi:hypothetical protein
MEYHDKIKPIRYYEESKGLLLNLGRKTYIWEFQHIDHSHKLALELPVFGRKFSVLFDGKLVSQGTRSFLQSFEFDADIHNLHMLIIEKGLGYDLFINGQQFHKNNVIKIKDETMTRFLQERQTSSNENLSEKAHHDSTTDLTQSTKDAKGTKDLEADPVAVSPITLEANIHDRLADPNPISFKNPSIRERSFVMPKSTGMKSPLLHRVTFPSKTQKISEFMPVDKSQPVKAETWFETDSPLKQHHEPRRASIAKFQAPVLSAYEIRTEKYHDADFSCSNDQMKDLIRLLYQIS